MTWGRQLRNQTIGVCVESESRVRPQRYGDAWGLVTPGIANNGWVGFIRVELFTDTVVCSVSTRENASTFQYLSLKHE